MRLHDVIYESLIRQSPRRAQQWADHSPIANVDNADVAMRQVNHYFRVQLGLLQHTTRGRELIQTTQAREVLEDQISQEQWVIGYQQYIQPLLVTYGLPEWHKAEGAS